jgi:hypothetical protein
MNRIVLAGILGGVAMFLAGSFTHVVLPLGHAGIKQFPNEEPVVAAIKSNVPDSGLYFFPGMPPGSGNEQKQQWEQRIRTGPIGILVYTPQGQTPMEPRQLLREFLSNVLVALTAACLLAQTRFTSFGSRVLFVIALGLVGWLALSVSYWNWYNFPTTYTLAELAHELIGFGAAGAVLAWRMKPSI